MLNQLKNNLNLNNLFFTEKQKSLMNFEPTLMLRHPYKKQSRHLSHNTPTKTSSLSSANQNKKQLHSSLFNNSIPNSTNKSSLQPPSKRQSQTQQRKQQKQIILSQQDVMKILQQSQKLISEGGLIQGMNLLKAMREASIRVNNNKLSIIIVWNLGVAYYQAGFLEEAHDEFIQVIQMLRDNSLEQQSSYGRIHTKMLQAKVQLQICILFSELGSHEDALKHARWSSKINYEMIYELMLTLCKQCLADLGRVSKQFYNNELRELTYSEINLCNNVMVMDHLHKLINDLGSIFGMQRKVNEVKELLIEFRAVSSQYLLDGRKVDMEMLYSNFSHPQISASLRQPNNNDQDILVEQCHQLRSKKQIQWVYESKILDRIQLKPLSPDHFNNQQSKYNSLFIYGNHNIIESITYLAISFYCYSTEVRFVERIASQRKGSHKHNSRSINQHQHHHNSQQTLQQDDILQSQHWLSRSLEIAYCFLTSNAPILNQILTVHDRFHSIDKQTIHEDKQVCGYFKVLRSLSKPKSIYSSSLGVGHNCATPIMIRVQAPRTKAIENHLWRIQDDFKQQQQQQHKRLSEQQKKQNNHSTTIDICSFTKNNKIKGLTTRIKILQFSNDTTTIKAPKQKQSHHKQTNKTTLNQNNNIHHHNQTQKRKISHSTIISDFITIESDHEKKDRIAKIYYSKNRSIIDKKGQMGKSKDMPKSARELDGKAIISEDLLFRPHSFDSKNTTYTDKNNFQSHRSQSIKHSYLNPHSIKKRRSLSQNGRVNNKQKLQKIVYNGSNGNMKFDGLKLTGKKLSETFQINNGLMQKLAEAHGSLDNQAQFQNNNMHGNIFINNNINLFISKPLPLSQHPKTTRQQLSTTTHHQLNPDMGKRLKFMTQRRFRFLNTQDNQSNEL